MNRSKSTTISFIKAVIWTAAVLLIGLLPYFFLHIINDLSEENISRREITLLNHLQVVLFVACAIIGAVLFDFIFTNVKLKGWGLVISIYIFPILLLGFLFYKYLLVYIQMDDQHDFGPGSMNARIMLVVSIIYAVFARTVFYVKTNESKNP